MTYEVRYQIGGDEHTDVVEAETAADAARMVQDRYLSSNDVFELIQVLLIEDETESVESASESR